MSAPMPLEPGVRLGPYEIVAALGAGGMGEVYRARDSRLDREVALKILPPALASDEEFQRRLHGEARIISKLSHPNICTLHDIGEQGGATFLVMEFVPGETLADRLARGTPDTPSLPLDVALQIAIQVADALAAAHRRGIVHRDLKPGNIMLSRAAGAGAPHVKLLDFGLAKSTAPAATSSASLSPTEAPHTMTAQGSIVGTLQYMAPEQIEGGQVDARSDIFAFGCVLYELLTGRKAFEGKTQANVIAAILEREPSRVRALQPRLPAILDEITTKCLAKGPDDRWQSAADLSTALGWANQTTGTDRSASASAAIEAPTRLTLARGAALAALALLLLAAGTLAGARYFAQRPIAGELVRFELRPPANVMLSPSPVASAAQLAMSPDGKHLAYVAAERRGVSRIWVNTLETNAARDLPGSEGAAFPFWSSDSRSIAFFADGKLKRIGIDGGKPEALADAPNGRGGAWNSNGDILFTPSPNGALYRVSSAGGEVTQETSLSDFEAIAHNWSQFLPDGRRFLYHLRSRDAELQGIYVETLGESNARKVLTTTGGALFSSDHLLFSRETDLYAIGFDTAALETRGQATRVAEGVGGNLVVTLGYAAVTASATGHLAHGPNVILNTWLQWRNRAGNVASAITSPGMYRSPRLSPDQQRIALTIVGPGELHDIYVFDQASGGRSRITSTPRNDWFPIWSSDGKHLYFASRRDGSSTLHRKAPGEPGEGEQVVPTSYAGMYPTDVTRDGAHVILHQITSGRGYDLVVVPLATPKHSETFASTRFNEIQARFSPDGKWVAYASDESGRFEVYVRPFPAGSGQWPISSEGGVQPEWRGDGKELFFLSATGKLMGADVSAVGETFAARAPKELLTVDVPETVAPYPSDYAVSADGQNFLINTTVDQTVKPALTVLLNWQEELKQRVPTR
jgi:Tol biopolymer transport system component